MRRTSNDWIAWSLLLGIAVALGADYYIGRQTGVSGADYVYRIVVTADRPAR
jgi:hypothetical protein